MKTKEEIIEILLDNFDHVYCYNCKAKNSNSSHCDECHRKYMYWSLSEECAEELAEEILGD